MDISKVIPAAVLLASLAFQTRPADPLQEAESLLQKQQYDAAESKLQTLVKDQAANPQAWFDLGFAESHLGKTTEAIAAYRKAVELSPKWFEANLNLGLSLAKAGKNDEAAGALLAATKLKPASGDQKPLVIAWLARAQVLEETDFKESFESYQQAAKLDPANPEIILGMGKLDEQLGHLPEAEQQYLKATGFGNQAAMERLISLYLKQKRLPDAENWLRKYMAVNPGNATAQVQLGRVLAAEGKTQEALTMLEAVNGNSSDPQAARELANLYADAKQYEKAAAILQPLVDKNPVDSDLHWNYGVALLHLHKYPEAEAELLKAVQQKPRLADAYGELAYAAQQNKHYELAIRALEARARFLPETAATYWVRAVSYDGLRAFKPAAENYKLFLAASNGKSPDQEFLARHRLMAIEPK